jgi:hypothetical protein
LATAVSIVSDHAGTDQGFFRFSILLPHDSSN